MPSACIHRRDNEERLQKLRPVNVAAAELDGPQSQILSNVMVTDRDAEIMSDLSVTERTAHMQAWERLGKVMWCFGLHAHHTAKCVSSYLRCRQKLGKREPLLGMHP